MFHFNKFKLDWVSFSVRLSSPSRVASFLSSFSTVFKEFSGFRWGRGKFGFSDGWYYENGLMLLYSPDFNYVYVSFPSGALSEIPLKYILNFFKDYVYKIKRCDVCIDTDFIKFSELQQKYLNKSFVSRFRSSSFVSSIKRNVQSNTIYFGSRQSDSFLRIYEKSKEIFLKTGKKVPEFVRIEFEAKNQIADKLFSLYVRKDIEGLKSFFLNYIDFKENENKTRIYNKSTWSKWVLLFGKIKKTVVGKILKSPNTLFWLKNQVSRSLYELVNKNPNYLNEILQIGREKFLKQKQKFLLTNALEFV